MIPWRFVSKLPPYRDYLTLELPRGFENTDNCHSVTNFWVNKPVKTESRVMTQNIIFEEFETYIETQRVKYLSHHSVRILNEYMGLDMTITRHLLFGRSEDVQGFTNARPCPIERLISCLHAHGALKASLATIWWRPSYPLCASGPVACLVLT